jgi:hypothetical protein
MAPPSLKDAAIATNTELDAIARDYGVFDTAEATGMDQWVTSNKTAVLEQIRKTREEMRHLEQSLGRLEVLVQTRFGREGSAYAILKEYVPLEGWCLTLVANYIALVALGSRDVNERRYHRITEYLRGAISLGRSRMPGRAMHFQKPVLDELQDQRVLYG